MRALLWICLLTTFFGAFSANGLFAQLNGINCFVYHRFGDDRYPSTNIDIDTFESHLAYLKEHNYRVVTFGEAAQLINSQTPIPDKIACLTIDDGYATVFTNAFPLLKKYGYTATIFICSGQVGNPGQMNWQEIKTLQDAGMEIGMHSHSHAYFLDHPKPTRLTAFEKDLNQSIRSFENNLGTVPAIYAYPYGEFSLEMREVLQKHGLQAAAAQFSGVIHPQSDIWALPRFPMNERYGQVESFVSKLSMSPLPLKNHSVIEPTLVNDQVPEITLTLDTALVNPKLVSCYWNGTRACTVESVAPNQLKINTDSPMNGRRSKYTITAPLKDKKTWCWYSQPWFYIEQ